MLHPLPCRRSFIVGRQGGVKINFYPAHQLPQPFHKGGIHRPQPFWMRRDVLGQEIQEPTQHRV